MGKTINAKDYGALGDGSDQSAAITAAQSAASDGVVHFDAGVYVTDGSVPSGNGVNTAFDFDAPVFPQPANYIQGLQDSGAASQSSRFWTVPWGDRISHGLAIQGQQRPSDPSVGYERTGMIFRYEQQDPTDYGPTGKIHDLVGTDWQGFITGANPTGRIWGTSSTITVNCKHDGSDGYVIIHEAGIFNDGTATSRMSRPNTKVGVSMISDGHQNSTTAFAALASHKYDAKWFHGYYADAQAVEENAFVLRNGPEGDDLARISKSGEIIGNRLMIAGGERVQGCDLPGRRAREVVLGGVSTGGQAVRLTADGLPPNAWNSLPISDYTSASVEVRLIARNASTGGQDVAWTMPIGILHRVVGAASTQWVGAEPVKLNYGIAMAINVTIGEDTVNGGLALTFAPPPGSTDQWSIAATVTATETT